MTKEQFENKRWGKGDRVVYYGVVNDVIQVDFVEELIGLGDADDLEGDISWVRYENVELIKQ